MNAAASRFFGRLKFSPSLLIAFAAFSLPAALPAADPALASGVAKGTYAPKGETPATLTNAAAFVDEKDDDKPIIVILSDKKIPAEKWTSEFDLMEAKQGLAFSGVVLWIDKDGEVIRWDTYWKGTQASVSGYFEAKFDSAKGAREITGTVKTSNTDPDSPKLDAKFHASLR